MLNNPVKIAIISDLNWGTELTEILLQRLVSRLNRLVHPQATLIFGDTFDDSFSSNSVVNLLYLKNILDKLDSPYMVIPGSFNTSSDQFFKIFAAPEQLKDICGIQFVSFANSGNHGNIVKQPHENLVRFRQCRKDYSGIIVAFPQTGLFPQNRAKASYKKTDTKTTISCIKKNDILLSLSSNHQKKSDVIKNGNMTFINTPGICEPPFPYTVINIEKGQIQSERQELAMDSNLQLFDNHIHTQLAYCNDNMMINKAISLAGDFGLSGLTFTEHSGQLYFDNKSYWDKDCLKTGIISARDEDNRMIEYLKLKINHQQNTVRFGLEVDCDYKGNLLIKKDDRSHFDFIIGAMHSLPGLSRDAALNKNDGDDYLFLLEKLLINNINVLAHPFRLFKRCGKTAPEELFLPTVKLLRKYNTAAEINFHTNEPPIEFIRICLNRGVRISLGSDAHQLAEIGDFAYHLALLKEAGFDGDLNDILLPK